MLEYVYGPSAWRSVTGHEIVNRASEPRRGEYGKPLHRERLVHPDGDRTQLR